MFAIEAPRISLSRRISPWIIKEGEEVLPDEDYGGDRSAESTSPDFPCDIYPVLSLLPTPPLPKDFRKECCDDDLEEWASLPQRAREALEGRLTMFLLKRGLSDFDYSTYGFTRLDLSQSALSDISLLLRLPATFPSLSYIDLSHNKLTDISPLSALSTITHLDVSHNKLTDLLFMYPEFYWNVEEPDSKMVGSTSRHIAQLSSMGWAVCGPATSRLRWVNYSHNLVTRLGGKWHWAHYPRITHLDLSYNRISDTRGEGRREAIQQQSDSEIIGADCGLAKLSLLHTLDLSHNHIRHVEGLNGLKSHKLVLTGNSIYSWEEEPHHRRRTAEAPPEEDFRSRVRQSVGGVRREGEWSKGAAELKSIRNVRKEKEGPTRAEKLRTISKVRKEIEGPTRAELRAIWKVRREEERRQEEGQRSADRSKELEILHRFDLERGEEEIPLKLLYRKPEVQWTERESIQEEEDVLREWLQEETIFRNWYDTDLKFICFPRGVNYSEDESNSGSSVDGRILPEPMGSAESSSSKCEVVFQRPLEDSAEESGEVEESIWKEWEKGVRVLYEGGSVGEEGDGEEWEEELVNPRKGEQEEVRLSYLFGEIPYEQKSESTEELLEVLYLRGTTSVEVLCRTSVDGQPEVSEGDDALGGAAENPVEDAIDDAVEDAIDDAVEDAIDDAAEDAIGGAVRDAAEVQLEGAGEEKGEYAEWEVYKRVSSSEVCKWNGEASNGAEGRSEWNAGRKEWNGVEKRSEGNSEMEESNGAEERSEGNAGMEESNGAEERSEGNAGIEESNGAQEKRTPERIPRRVGLRSLLYLDELHLENNCISTLRMFQGMYCLRLLFIQHNRIEDIGELIFLGDLHNLQHLDMTGNPVTNWRPFEDIVLFLHPSLKSLNDVECTALKRKPIKLFWNNPFFRANRQRDDILLATELLRENHISWSGPEMEYLDRVGVLLLVGPEGSGKELLCQLLCDTLPDKIHLSPLCTTDKRLLAEEHFSCYRYVSEEEFASLLCSGKLVSASHDGQSFQGLEKRHLGDAARKGRVLVSAVDLETALYLRGIGFGGGPRLVLVVSGRGQKGGRSAEECLNTHLHNPGLFEFAVYHGERNVLMRLKDLVEEMLESGGKYSLSEAQETMMYRDSVAVMEMIDERLKHELEVVVPIW